MSTVSSFTWPSKCAALLALALTFVGVPASAQTAASSPNLAPGFTSIQASDKLLLMPIDVELY